jgi:micrococcal nuclease
MAKEPAYTYTIKEIVKFIDGDTIDVILDLGFHIYVKKRIRLYGINTPETRTRNKEEKKRGLAAKARLIELCEESPSDNPMGFGKSEKILVLKCHGLGKYGRVLGEIFNTNCSVNQMLVLEGHAEEYLGKKK